MRLYLDVDGVLHAFRQFAGQAEADRYGHYRACRDGGRVFWPPTFFQHVPALTEALRPFPELQIVMHAPWRFMWREVRPDDIADWLGELGPKFARMVPRHLRAPTRYELIRMDFAHDRYRGPWVAVDDFGGEFVGCPAANIVVTDSKLGLGEAKKMAELVEKISAQYGESSKAADR